MTDKRGAVLITVLLIFVVIISIVSDFSYGVFVSTSSLKNFNTSERLSVLLQSTIDFTGRYVSDFLLTQDYTTIKSFEVDLTDMIPEERNTVLRLIISDENAKLNINRLYGIAREETLGGFIRLLRSIKVDEGIGIKIADWIDSDSDESLPLSEKDAKNGKLYSIDEILQIHGIDEEIFKKIEPYVTCYSDISFQININTAPKEVLMSLHEDITESIAENIIKYREGSPFKEKRELRNIAGITDAIYQTIQSRIDVKAKVYEVIAIAESIGIRKTVRAVFDSNRIVYYRED